MKKVFLSFLAAALVLTFVAVSPASASSNQFVGKWVNSDSNTNGITKINIALVSGTFTVAAFGKCTPTDCDFGVSTVTAFGPDVSAVLPDKVGALMAVFKESFAVDTLIINPAKGDTLQVQDFVHFTDNSGRTDYTKTYTFEHEKLVIVLPTKDCLPFNTANLKIVNQNSYYTLTDGVESMLIMDTLTDAQNALKLAQQYGQFCFIGRDNKRSNRKDFIVEYWMGGKNVAPILSPEDCISYSTATLKIVKESNDWLLTDGSSRMLILDNQSDAEDTLLVAKAFKFQCFIGRNNTRSSRIDFIIQYWK